MTTMGEKFSEEEVDEIIKEVRFLSFMMTSLYRYIVYQKWSSCSVSITLLPLNGLMVADYQKMEKVIIILIKRLSDKQSGW